MSFVAHVDLIHQELDAGVHLLDLVPQHLHFLRLVVLPGLRVGDGAVVHPSSGRRFSAVLILVPLPHWYHKGEY